MEHYFAEKPTSPPRERTIRLLYGGKILTVTTGSGIFASKGLDPGTRLLVENLSLSGGERVLDLGCGWGPIGIAAAYSLPRGSVVMVDINKRAVALARKNVKDAGLSNAEVRSSNLYDGVAGERFHVIATNPPYHAGRETILKILDEAPTHLLPGGRLVMVGKGAQGMILYQHYLEKRWNRVVVLARKSGFRVVSASEPIL